MMALISTQRTGFQEIQGSKIDYWKNYACLQWRFIGSDFFLVDFELRKKGMFESVSPFSGAWKD